MFSIQKYLTASVALMLLLGGLLLPLWELSAASIVFAGLTGRTFLSIAIGIGLDSIYGPPVGPLSFIPFPFTILALVLIVVYKTGGRFLFTKAFPDYL